MDKRNRYYYLATFSFEAYDYRLRILKLIPTVKIHINQCDGYQMKIGCHTDYCECLEYELRKAERLDKWSKWRRIDE